MPKRTNVYDLAIEDRPKTRQFGGCTYRRSFSLRKLKTKRDAQAYAARFRKRGWRARVVRDRDAGTPERYQVWKRKTPC